MLYVLLIILMNVALGFAGAVYLGRRYVMMEARSAAPSDALLDGVHNDSAEHGIASAYDVESSDVPAAIDRLLVDEEEPPPAHPAPHAEPHAPPHAAGHAPHPASEHAAHDDAPHESLHAEHHAGEHEHHKVSELELAVEELRKGCREYETQLEEIEDRARIVDPPPDEESLRALADVLQKANHQHASRMRTAQEAAYAQLEPEAELLPASSAVRGVLANQHDQLEHSDDLLKRTDYHGHAEEVHRKLLVELVKLFGANDRVRDVLGDTACLAAQFERREMVLPDVPDNDPDGLPNRTGVEAELADWWRTDHHHARKICMIAVDFDQFHKFNEQHGRVRSNLLLKAAYRVMASLLADNVVVRRLGGQRFVLLLPDSGLRQAITTAEQLRQQLEVTTFAMGEEPSHLHISCGITPSLPQDDGPTTISRAEEALKEAKRAGRNRCFSHDGKAATPVVPPNLSVEELTETVY